MQCDSRTAIVTGAASGLGRALAVRLARDGWRIAICDIDGAGSQETLRLVNSAGGRGRVERLDVTQADEWQSLRSRLQGDWPQLDLLVNNAGVTGAGEVGVFPLENWDWVINVNLWNAIHGCHTFVDWLKQNPNGAHIINTASMAAIESAPGTAAYNVTKAGIVSLSETLYAELLAHRVGVTVVCPGFFAANLTNSARFAGAKWENLFHRLSSEATMTADYVADRAVWAMQRKRLYVMLPAGAHFRWILKRIAPTTFIRGVAKVVHGMAKSAEQAAAPSRTI